MKVRNRNIFNIVIILIFFILLVIILFKSSFIDRVYYNETINSIGDVSSIIGDINGDKKVNTQDYILIKKYIINISTLTDDSKTRADVNGDGNINTSDYILIKKLILGFDVNGSISQGGSRVSPMSTGFEITYYWGVPAEYIDSTQINYMKQAGITIAHLRSDATSLSTTDQYRKNMASAITKLKEAGIKVLVTDNYTVLNRIVDKSVVPTDDDAIRIIKEMIDFYGQYNNVIGYDITDEPSTSSFSRLGKIVSYIKQNDPGRLAYINLFPNYASSSQLGSSNYYEGYLKKFVNEVNPQILSVDHYPEMFQSSVAMNASTINASKDYLYRNYSDILKAGVKPMVIVLMTKHWVFRNITANEIAFQVSANLAFGMKRISYYTYSVDALDASGAFVDKSHSPTTHYYDAQKINKWAYAIGSQLYSKSVSNVYGINEVGAVTDYNNSGKTLGVITSSSLNSNNNISALITFYSDNSFLITNTSLSDDTEIITFDGNSGNLNSMQWFNPDTGTWQDITGETGSSDVWIMPLSQRISKISGHCVLLRKK